jgi:preprotein translocase subunit SecG
MGLQAVLVVIFLFLSLALVGLVLIQHGKGADAGAAFGGGASATVFGAKGSANFVSRLTAILATVWFVLAMTLAWFAFQVTDQSDLLRDSIMGDVDAPMIIPAPEVAPQQGQVPAPVLDDVLENDASLPDDADLELPASN